MASPARIIISATTCKKAGGGDAGPVMHSTHAQHGHVSSFNEAQQLPGDLKRQQGTTAHTQIREGRCSMLWQEMRHSARVVSRLPREAQGRLILGDCDHRVVRLVEGEQRACGVSQGSGECWSRVMQHSGHPPPQHPCMATQHAQPSTTTRGHSCTAVQGSTRAVPHLWVVHLHLALGHDDLDRPAVHAVLPAHLGRLARRGGQRTQRA